MTAPTDNAALRAALEDIVIGGRVSDWLSREGRGFQVVWRGKEQRVLYADRDDAYEALGKLRTDAVIAALAAAIPPEQDGYAEGRALPAGVVLTERNLDDDCGCPEEMYETPWGELHMHLSAGKASNACLDNGDEGERHIDLTTATVDEARAAIFGWANVTPTDRHAEGRIAGLEDVNHFALERLATMADHGRMDAAYGDFSHPTATMIADIRKMLPHLRTIANGGTAA